VPGVFEIVSYVRNVRPVWTGNKLPDRLRLTPPLPYSVGYR